MPAPVTELDLHESAVWSGLGWRMDPIQLIGAQVEDAQFPEEPWKGFLFWGSLQEWLLACQETSAA